MDCPYCGNKMSEEGVFKYCKGRFLRWHAWIQFTAMDGSFQTKSENLARWFSQSGFKVNNTGRMFDMYARR